MLNETNELERAIDRKIASATGKRTRTTGTVSRIETDGTIYVLFDGSDSDTIISKSTASVKIGDRVSVRVENGRAAIEGNSSDPAASSTKLSDVSGIARTALADASRAQGAADAAEIDAQRAKGAADSAQQSANAAQQSADSASQAAQNAWNHADDASTAAQNAWNRAGDAATAAANAQQSADRANLYSNAALDQLGVVQDVAGILTWASEHGSFAKTGDTAIVDGKVYFVKDGTDYAPVVDPQAADLASYYELTVNEDMNDFIMAHLAVTSRGLWVLPAGKGSASDEQHAAGYKMLLASTGCYIYDGSGVLVRSDTASGTDFAEGRSFHFGSDDAYILYTPASGSNPAQITIGGANVVLGESRTLSELLGEVDATFDFKVTDAYSQDGLTATLTAHVYKGGEDVASRYPESSFAWYRKSENGLPMVPLGNGRAITVARSTVGFGAAIKCNFTPPNDAELLTGDDDGLTTQDGTPITARTPSGDYVRVADLAVETTVFDTDKVMLVGSEDEHLVSIETLKETFGDGDYERLSNRPSIEGVTLSGDKSFPDLGIFQTDSQGYSVADDYTLTTMDINALWANAQPIGG